MSILQNKCFAGQHWPSSIRATDFSWWRFFAWSSTWSPAGGRGSCAQVLRNSRLSPASGRLRGIGTPKCRLWRHFSCQFGDTISDDNIGASCHWLMWLFASWFSDNLAGWFHLCGVVNVCVTEYYVDSALRIACQVVCFFMGPGRVVIMLCMSY